MANKMKAIGAYRPRVESKGTISTDDLVRFISQRTGLNESGVRQVLLELRDAFLYHARMGNAVKFDGLGTYTPTIKLDGTMKVGHRTDKALTGALNARDGFTGNIKNRENIGKTMADLIVMWNADNPSDLIT